MDDVQMKEMVRARYGGIAAAGDSGCCGPTSSCCGPADTTQTKSRNMGYSDTELAAVPEGQISASVAAIRKRLPRCNPAKP
jgi:hypothetical protein